MSAGAASRKDRVNSAQRTQEAEDKPVEGREALLVLGAVQVADEGLCAEGDDEAQHQRNGKGKVGFGDGAVFKNVLIQG